KSLPLSVGVVELACDEHPSEHATLVVIDREPAAITDADGRFALRELSGEACDLDIFRNSSRPRRVHVVLVPDARADVSLDVARRAQSGPGRDGSTEGGWWGYRARGPIGGPPSSARAEPRSLCGRCSSGARCTRPTASAATAKRVTARVRRPVFSIPSRAI